MQEKLRTSWNDMQGKLAEWLDAAILNLPNIVIALLIFIAASWLASLLRKWSYKGLERVVKTTSVRNLLSNLFAIIVISVGILLSLSVLNLDNVLKSLLAGAGVAGLAVGLAIQGPLSNTFSGIFLALRDVINVGDWVITNGYRGRVIEIDLRNTKIMESDNNIVLIPNKMILENPFKNYGLTKRIRSTVTCGVAYDSNLEEVRDLVLSTLSEIFPPKGNEEIEFHFLEFGDSSINFQTRFWIDATTNRLTLEAKSKAIIAIKKAFDENGIEIPFPIRTLYQGSDFKLSSFSKETSSTS